MEQGANKRIAKNTVLLYFRMLITMGVSLYTSRVILVVLGVDDFGIYQAVAGVVGMFAFLNSALATGTSRFITYAIGEKQDEKTNRVFSVSLLLHVFIAIIFIVLAETIGLYFIYKKLVLPIDRMDSILWVFQFTVVGSVVTIIQVPYTADIISHEQMSMYAYLSIFEVVLKLLIVFLLTKAHLDKLLLYSLLLLATQILVFLVYYFYCKKNYNEANRVTIKLNEDKGLFKEIGSFSGWSLLSVSSSMLANQGVVVLLNMFFLPAVVSARAISNQVNNVVNQFVQNFRTAINPQIVKTYAQNDRSHSSFLVLISTKVSFYLVLLIGMPLLLNAEFLLNIWLVEVPEYTTVFLQLIIVQSFVQTIDNSLYYGLYACGKIKQNAIISPTIALLGFPICYMLFKLGCSPVSLSWCYIGVYSFIGLIIKPILLKKYANYSIKEMIHALKQCLLVFVPCLLTFFLLDRLVRPIMTPVAYFISSTAISIIVVLLCVSLWGIEEEIMKKGISLVIERIKRK